MRQNLKWPTSSDQCLLFLCHELKMSRHIQCGLCTITSLGFWKSFSRSAGSLWIYVVLLYFPSLLLCCILGEFLSSITQFINFLLDYAHSRIYSIPSFINFNKNSCISKHFTWFYSCPITCVSFWSLFHNFCSLFMSTTINYSLKLISSWMHSCEHLPSLLAVFLKIN